MEVDLKKHRFLFLVLPSVLSSRSHNNDIMTSKKVNRRTTTKANVECNICTYPGTHHLTAANFRRKEIHIFNSLTDECE